MEMYDWFRLCIEQKTLSREDLFAALHDDNKADELWKLFYKEQINFVDYVQEQILEFIQQETFNEKSLH